MRSGWVGGGVTDEKGGSRKRGGQDPLTPPLDTPMLLVAFFVAISLLKSSKIRASIAINWESYFDKQQNADTRLAEFYKMDVHVIMIVGIGICRNQHEDQTSFLFSL